MTSQALRWSGLAACAGALAIAWLLTDSLGAWVILPLLASLTTAGLLIAQERRAAVVAILAGSLQAAHAGLLLVEGPAPLTLPGIYLVCALALAACGLGLRRAPPPPATPDPLPDLEDRPL